MWQIGVQCSYVLLICIRKFRRKSEFCYLPKRVKTKCLHCFVYLNSCFRMRMFMTSIVVDAIKCKVVSLNIHICEYCNKKFLLINMHKISSNKIEYVRLNESKTVCWFLSFRIIFHIQWKFKVCMKTLSPSTHSFHKSANWQIFNCFEYSFSMKWDSN